MQDDETKGACTRSNYSKPTSWTTFSFSGAATVDTKSGIDATRDNANLRLLPEPDFKDVARHGPKPVSASR